MLLVKTLDADSDLLLFVNPTKIISMYGYIASDGGIVLCIQHEGGEYHVRYKDKDARYDHFSYLISRTQRSGVIKCAGAK